MAIHKPQAFLLAYDIADPRRLVKVHRTCRQWGVPIQYSVFLVPLTPRILGSLLQDLSSIIDDRADDIRVYPLPDRLEVAQYGRQGLPEGIALVGGRFGGEQALAGRVESLQKRSDRRRRSAEPHAAE